jgi:hypothetical protein
MGTSNKQAASQAVDTVEPDQAAPADLTTRLDVVLKHLLQEHGGVLALIKRLGMRSNEQPLPELEPQVPVEPLSRDLGEMAALYAALSEVVQRELALDRDADPSDLADALAALGAINPGSPEWGPAFLHMSELVEAQVIDDVQDFPPTSGERGTLLAAS